MNLMSYCSYVFFIVVGFSLVTYAMELDPGAPIPIRVQPHLQPVGRAQVPSPAILQPPLPVQPPVPPRPNEEEQRQEEERRQKEQEDEIDWKIKLPQDILSGFSYLLNKLSYAISRPGVNILDHIAAEYSAENIFENLAQQFDPAARAGQGGAGNKAFSNFWRTLAQQFAQDGAGKATLDNITRGAIQTFFETLARHMEAPLDGAGAEGNREGRAISHALQAFLTMITNELKSNRLQELFNTLIANWNQIIQEDGPLAELLRTIDAGVKAQIERVNATIEEGVAGIGEQANIQAKKLSDDLAKKVDEVGENLKGHYKDVAQDVEKRYEDVAKDVEKRYERIKEATARWGVATALFAASAWFGSRFFWNSIERYFTQPELITDSSYKDLWQQMNNYFWPQPLVFREMVFSKEVKRELDNIVAITKHIAQENQKKQAHVRYLNVLLWGPPGTGKTMFAKELAKKSGLDYAITSGAAFSKFDVAGGITAIDRLFNWAEKSTKGLIIFIDEAEAFLAERDRTRVKEENQLVTHFLSRTGEGSSKVMLIFATNKPEVLDEAIRRRTQRSIELGLPAKPEAAKILRLYRDKTLLDKEHNTSEFIESVKENLSDEVIDDLADKLKGLAASELEDFINDIKVNADITDSRRVTNDVIEYVIELSLRKHKEFISHFHHQAASAA